MKQVSLLKHASIKNPSSNMYVNRFQISIMNDHKNDKEDSPYFQIRFFFFLEFMYFIIRSGSIGVAIGAIMAAKLNCFGAARD